MYENRMTVSVMFSDLYETINARGTREVGGRVACALKVKYTIPIMENCSEGGKANYLNARRNAACCVYKHKGGYPQFSQVRCSTLRSEGIIQSMDVG